MEKSQLLLYVLVGLALILSIVAITKGGGGTRGAIGPAGPKGDDGKDGTGVIANIGSTAGVFSGDGRLGFANNIAPFYSVPLSLTNLNSTVLNLSYSGDSISLPVGTYLISYNASVLATLGYNLRGKISLNNVDVASSFSNVWISLLGFAFALANSCVVKVDSANSLLRFLVGSDNAQAMSLLYYNCSIVKLG